MEKTTGTKITLLLIFLAAALATGAEILDEGAQETSIELMTPVQEQMQQTISVDFRDTPIDDVLRIMAKQADVDIIKSPKVQGTVTATLSDVPLSEALSNILEAHGYGYVASDNMIRVMAAEDIVDVREKMDSKVYTITYADVVEVEQALRKFLSEQGSISANPGTSNIIVTDVESKMKAIDRFINVIDRITPQILVEAKIYDITSKDRLDLGVEWQAGTATGYGKSDVDGILGNAIGTLGNVMYGTKTDGHGTGAFNGTTNYAESTDGLVRFGVLNNSVRIDAIVRANQEDIRAKLLANPRVLCIDNQQAEIKIVEEIPYQEQTQTSGGGNIGTTEFRDVGVELRVVPHLTRDGLIRLTLNPKFSVKTGEALPVTSGSLVSPQPIVATRETLTTALIKDGQTVVIGGLKEQTANTQVNKIPLLGDLPLLGGLFKFEGEEVVNSELVVFITPYVIVEPELDESEQRALDDMIFKAPRPPEPKLSQAEEENEEKDQEQG